MSKYHSHKIADEDGNVFDSKKEYRRWNDLLLLERAGAIKNLQRQVVYELLPKQTDEHGKCLERPCTYKADFVYYDNDKKKIVVEDAKGMRTEVYRLKKKLMLYMRGIIIQEV